MKSFDWFNYTHHKYAQDKRGFTLIELLVVITIIAILTTIGLTLFTTAQKQARIAKRIKDLQAIQNALELYYSTNKAYPCASDQCGVAGGGPWKSECSGQANNAIIPGLVPTYMPVLPSDPSMDTANLKSCYRYKSDGNDYKLIDWNIAEFSPADYLSQKNLVDPASDDNGGSGSECSKVDASNPKAWAVYSNNTGVNDSTNPACW